MIDINADQLERAQRMLMHIPGAAPKAMSNAINRAITTARTEASRKVREMYYITNKNITATIKLTKASPSNPVALIRSKSSPIALSKFKIPPTGPSPGRKSPIVARVIKGGGGPIAHAFVARMKSGHIGVFNRVGKKSKPIDQRYGPSVPQMLGNPNVTQWVEVKAKEKLDERLDHEIRRILEARR